MPTATEPPMSEERYIPAAGWRVPTPLFDPVMAVTTRERRWRGAVLREALATNPATILDVGCGTGGRLVIADYGWPHDRLMRAAFLYVQLLDGFQSTRQHAAGQLPELITEAGFNVETIDRLRTISRTLELLAATPNVPRSKDQMSTKATAVSS